MADLFADERKKIADFKMRKMDAEIDGEPAPVATPPAAAGMSQSDFGGRKKTKEQIAADAAKLAAFMRARGR